jgi:hypothetical protein
MDMPGYAVALLLPLLCLGILHAGSAASTTTGTPDGSELWGYVEVRPGKSLKASDLDFLLRCYAFREMSPLMRCCRRGSPVLVVLQEPAEDVDAGETMADRPLAAGRPCTNLPPLLTP